MKKRILFYAVKYQGDFKKISSAILHNEAYEDICYHGKFITIIDDEYPEKLLRLKYKPWILFYEGDIALLKMDCISVVGSRTMSEYGADCVIELIHNLNQKYCIVSGLAKGIDAKAHDIALLEQRKTIAVIGCGINICYPKEHTMLYNSIKNVGLVISEYPFDVKPLSHHFPWRNRLISALSETLVVIEAKQRSGTLISVNEALDIGNTVYCFPHRYFDKNGVGCNLLISQGCMILNGVEEIKLI